MIAQNFAEPNDRRVWQQAHELAANGYQVSLIRPAGHGKRHEIVDGISLYLYPLPHKIKGLLRDIWVLAWQFILACRVLAREGFDVIHACNPPDDLFLIGGFFKFMFEKKFLFDHHIAMPELYETKFRRRGFIYRMLLDMEKLTFKSADVSIAPNESYRQIAINRGGMPPNKVFVVRSAPHLERLRTVPPVDDLRKGKKYLVGYVGEIGEHEGVQHLIEAARHIVHDLKRTDIHFALVGSGPLLADFKNLASEKQLNDHVTFLGHVSEQLLLDMLNTADICVNPHEVNPANDASTVIQVVEYMALGKPVVQFELTEGIFSAGGASLYAKPNDAHDFAAKIMELIDDPHKCAALGALGRARVERALLWDHEVPRLLAAYDAVFASKNSAPNVRMQ